MRDTLKPVWFIFRTALLLAVAAYPITMVLQWFTQDIEPFTIYHQFLFALLDNHWDWILVIVITFMFGFKESRFTSYADVIRTRQYELELKRWEDTAYIAPIHLYYLLAPPRAFSFDASSQALDSFYKNVINDFRDRVYINARFTKFHPTKRYGLISVLGYSTLLQLIVNITVLLLSIAGLLYFAKDAQQGIGWGKAFIPVIIYFLISLVDIIRAICLVNPNKMDEIIEQHFDQHELKVNWRELFPDRPYGEAILFAWRADCERRQRLAHEASGQVVPDPMAYTSPGLAPKPFPSEDLPEWAELSEEAYLQALVRNHRAVGSTGGNIVQFPKR